METVKLEISMPEEKYERLARLAETRNQSASELLDDLATEFLETTRAREEDYRAVEEAQASYPGEYVAVRQGQILAHASQAHTLLQRIQEQFGLTGADVLLVKIDAPDLRIRHPQLTSA